MMNRLYLDNCATTPVAPEVAEYMLHIVREVPGNPSSIHHEGRQAARVLAESRAGVAAWIGARPAEIVFTSSGTEANNLAIGGLVGRAIRQHGRAHVVTSAAEHPSVSTRLDWEKRQHGDRLEITRIGVDAEGQLDFDALAAATNPETTLVALLLVNNETGVVQPLDRLKALKLQQPGVPWLLDVVQAQGKLELDVRLLPFEMLSFSAHKLYAPKGVGALFVRGGVELDPLLVGGSQEKYRRAGTENLAGIAAFARAIEICPPPAETNAHLARLEEEFLAALQQAGVSYQVNGPASPGATRLPGFLNLSFEGVASREDLQIALDLEGISLSSTSACHSGVVAESHVLEAMGISGERRSGAVRLLFSRYHTAADARRAAETIAAVVNRMQ